MNEPEDPYRIAMSLTSSRSHFVTRLTGGCGSLTAESAQGFLELFSDAFYGYSGVMLFGGTRMIRKDDESVVVPGITEVAPVIRRINKYATVLGVIPRTDELFIRKDGILIVGKEEEATEYVTIVHPDQDICIVVQADVNKGSKWLAEANVCLKITDLLLAVNGWKSLLVSYSGGQVTKQEIEKTAHMKWPVLLIEGGGGTTDALAFDEDFRRMHPNVHSVKKEVMAIRRELKDAGALKKRANENFARSRRETFHIVNERK
ncbi:MAG: hypothetical protein WAV31_03645 [Candidatus Moraniibacteriota bacterium]